MVRKSSVTLLVLVLLSVGNFVVARGDPSLKGIFRRKFEEWEAYEYEDGVPGINIKKLRFKGSEISKLYNLKFGQFMNPELIDQAIEEIYSQSSHLGKSQQLVLLRVKLDRIAREAGVTGRFRPGGRRRGDD